MISHVNATILRPNLHTPLDGEDPKIDLYGILGLSKGATRDEIRKAYRKLALTHHPDKVKQEDREEADTKFKAISQAYEILYDDEKRAMYDQHGMAAFDGSKGPGMDMDDILAQMFGGGMAGMGRGPKKPAKGEDEQKIYPITLEELYTGKSQKFNITKNVVCPACHGKGGKDASKSKQCQSCKGKGARQVLRQSGPFLTQELVVCDTCQGRGSVYSEKDKCKKCKGRTVISEKKQLELYIPPGSNHGDRIVLAGEADQIPDQEPGDIVFVLDEKEHEVFKRQGSDLSATLKISLVESLCGLSRVVIKTLDGRGLFLDHQKPAGGILKPSQVIKISNEGMPIKKSDQKGSLFLEVEVEFPEDDWLQDKKISAETVDDVQYDAHASLEEFGASENGADGAAWEDDDEEEVRGAQCAQQ